jgi:hypothetical protein
MFRKITTIVDLIHNFTNLILSNFGHYEQITGCAKETRKISIVVS